MRNLPDPPSPSFLSGCARRYLLHVLRHRTRSYGRLPARLRIPPRGTPAREDNGAPGRRITEPRHPGLRKGAARPRTAAHFPLRDDLRIPPCRLRRVVDRDVLEALDALIRTYRTLQSGVYYESRPNNPLAAAIFDALRKGLDEYRSSEQRELGMTKTRRRRARPAGLPAALRDVSRQRPCPRPRLSGCAARFHPPNRNSGAFASSAIICADSAWGARAPPGRRAFSPC